MAGAARNRWKSGAKQSTPLADRNSPRPVNGRVAVMWFGYYPAPGFQEWITNVGAEEFRPQMRGQQLDFAALDDLARLCMGSAAIQEWLSTVPSHVVAALLEGRRVHETDRVLEELAGNSAGRKLNL